MPISIDDERADGTVPKNMFAHAILRSLFRLKRGACVNLIRRPDCWCVLVAALTLASGVVAEESVRSEAESSAHSSSDLFAEPPTIQPNPNRRAPLAAVVTVRARRDVVATLWISDGEREWTQPTTPTPKPEHRLAAVGLRPDRRHLVRVKIADPATGETQLSEPLEFTTPGLPRNFPPLETRASHPQEMEPGVTIFPVTLWFDDKPRMDYGYLVAVDESGEVVWYLDSGHRTTDVRVLSNGHLLYLHANFRHAFEVDVLGNLIRQWHASRTTPSPTRRSIRVYADTMHHELAELPDGNFLTLGTEVRQFDEYPGSTTDQDHPSVPAYVVCDTIYSFRPSDGWIEQSWSLAEMIDRRHFGYSSRSDFWKSHYAHRLSSPPFDWTHANGLTYCGDDDSVIVSLRHLDGLVKIDLKTGQIRWILSDPLCWPESMQRLLLIPTGNVQWPHHQHAPQLTPRGTILLYDNGSVRARPFEEPTPAASNHSRVVEFAVDEDRRSVRQVWEYSGDSDEPFYSPFLCEADWLPATENILVTDGGRIETAQGIPTDKIPGQRQWARILEINREDQKKVFELVVRSEPQSMLGWSIYRSSRIRSLAGLSADMGLRRMAESNRFRDNVTAK